MALMVFLRSCQHVVANSQGVASTKLERDISSANAFVARPRKSLGARFDVHSQSTLADRESTALLCSSVFIMMLKNGCMLLAHYILVHHDMILWIMCVKPFSIMQQRYFGDMKNPIFASTLESCMFLSNHFSSVSPSQTCMTHMTQAFAES